MAGMTSNTNTSAPTSSSMGIRPPALRHRIKPIKPGTVVDVVHSNRGLGNYVIIDHGNGLSSVYGHMFSTQVQIGQAVNKDSVIGFEGSTGASTGPHVHLEVRVNGQPTDPLQYIGNQFH